MNLRQQRMLQMELEFQQRVWMDRHNFRLQFDPEHANRLKRISEEVD